MFWKKNKKNEVAKNKRREKLQDEKEYREKAIANANFIAEFVNTLLQDCQTDEEQELKIKMAMNTHPEIFIDHHQQLMQVAMDNKITRLKSILDVAKGSDEDTIKKLGNLKEAVSTSKELEDKR